MRQEALDAREDVLPEPEDIEDEVQPDEALEDALDDAEGRE